MLSCKDISMIEPMMQDAQSCLDSAASSLSSVHNFNLDRSKHPTIAQQLRSYIDQCRVLEQNIAKLFQEMANS